MANEAAIDAELARDDTASGKRHHVRCLRSSGPNSGLSLSLTGMLMTKESPSSIPGARRAARIAAAAWPVAALTATGAAPVFAVDDPAPAPVKPAATSDRGDKLGKADADVLAKAEAKGEKNITMMVATAPGATEQVSKQLDAVKGSVLGQTYDKLGYVRATVPTKSAESTIKAASKLSSVLGIDLKQEIKLDDPMP
ncbi:hypothetical protein SBADM41S_04800 [Streptomyces badius]